MTFRMTATALTAAFLLPLSLGAQAQQKPGSHYDALQPRPTAQAELQGFSIVLVVGELTGTTTSSDNVPAAARKALNDMRDFLPYKNYRLLDAHWIVCCGSATSSGRLRGAEDQDYMFGLSTSRMPGNKVNVKFTMREEPSVARVGSAPTTAQGRAPAKRGFDRSPIFDTSFVMDIGETIVVGTSRLRGDKALIALLTAARRSEPTPTR